MASASAVRRAPGGVTGRGGPGATAGAATVDAATADAATAGAAPRPATPAEPERAATVDGHSSVQGVAFFLAFLLIALFYVWTRTEVVKATYELGKIQRQIEDERSYSQKLRLEILTLKAPDRLAAVAVQRLDMQPPGEGQVVVVE